MGFAQRLPISGGSDGNPHGQHADSVAELVVGGESAEALLDINTPELWLRASGAARDGRTGGGCAE